MPKLILPNDGRGPHGYPTVSANYIFGKKKEHYLRRSSIAAVVVRNLRLYEFVAWCLGEGGMEKGSARAIKEGARDVSQVTRIPRKAF